MLKSGIRSVKADCLNLVSGIFTRLRHKAYRLVSPVYNKAFSCYLVPSPENLDSLDVIKLSDVFAELDHTLNFFLLHASFGDKWCILSFLGSHLSLYPSSRIVADEADKSLIELFLQKEIIASKFIFVSKSRLLSLSAYFRPVSRVSTQIVDSWCAQECQHVVTPYLLKNGLPFGTIRHLHVVYYPYFNELLNLHGVSYGTLIKTLLYLPADTLPSSPHCFSPEDHREVEKIIYDGKDDGGIKPFILINAVNFSHSSLSAAQLCVVVSVCSEYGYQVFINATLADDHFDFTHVNSHCPYAKLIVIPPKLLSLICDQADAVVGVIGGAMNIAVQFSSAHVLSLQTPPLGFGVSDQEFLGKWGMEKVWEWIDQDWPCLRPGRVVENVYFGQPDKACDDMLRKIVSSFLIKIKSLEPI